MLGLEVQFSNGQVRLPLSTHVTGVLAGVNCHHCVYLKLDGYKGLVDCQLPEIVVGRGDCDGSVYTGQTVDDFRRERKQRAPQHHLCLRHGIKSAFDLDCCEMASIAVTTIIFGTLSRNKSPLGKYVYVQGKHGG
ncbi:hypothetical protein HK101_006090, partial [Irineochytrium annulatum]